MIDMILGKRVGMTQALNDEGKGIPISVIEAGPCIVVQLKSVKRDGYAAIQVGYGEIPTQLMDKTMLGHFKKAGIKPLQHLQEIRTDDACSYKTGDVIKCDIFRSGQRVKVTRIFKNNAPDAELKQGTKNNKAILKKQVTVRGLRIARVDPEQNLLMIEGLVPASEGGVLTIQLQ